MSDSKIRPAIDVAAEIVPDPVKTAESWTNYIVSGKHCIELLAWSERDMADEDRDALREVFVEAIEQARYDGAVGALHEVANRAEAAAHGRTTLLRAEGLIQAAGIARELASRPRRT